MTQFKYHFGFMMQSFGLVLVGICFFGGLVNGDYHKQELYQFLGGMLIFYLGHLMRRIK